MFARIHTVLFMLASFALFLVSASPLPNHGVSVRETRSEACGCGNDLVQIVLALEAEVDVAVGFLDGSADPYGPVAQIVAALKVAAEASANVKVDTPLTQVEISLCVQVIVKIIIEILVALCKYSIDVAIALAAEIDAQLSLCLKIWIGLVVSLQAEIYAALQVQVHVGLLATLKLAATIAVGGLEGLLGGASY